MVLYLLPRQQVWMRKFVEGLVELPNLTKKELLAIVRAQEADSGQA